MEIINRPHRRSVRLKEYDYSQPGEYFVTICTRDHECTLGEIINGEMRLNAIGKIVEEEWLRTAIIRPDIQLDLYVVMPNHIHGIIVLNEGRGHVATCPYDGTIRETNIQFDPNDCSFIQICNNKTYQWDTWHTRNTVLAAQLLRPRHP
ncbi:MAG: hypothetical protein ABSD46_05690 [Bacteroidota bacterium]